MFHSSLNIPFLNDPMFWRTLLTTTSTSHVIREGESVEDESGEDKQAFNYIILLNQGK